MVCSDEEDGVVRKPPSKVPDLFYIPVTPEIDEPEESGWGQLEVRCTVTIRA